MNDSKLENIIRLVNDILSVKSKMFSMISTTWNPIVGCRHLCKYCYARKYARTRLRNHPLYRNFTTGAKFNKREFERVFKPAEFVFVCDMGDLFGNWVPSSWIRAVIYRTKKFPQTHFLFLTKNPSRYFEFLDDFGQNAYLGATIETNRDEVAKLYSRAPPPSLRFHVMRDLNWEKKFLSIEPILDFDLSIFAHWIEEIDPLIVYIGYDNHRNYLMEPKQSKTEALISKINNSRLVIRKTIRKAWTEEKLYVS